MSRSKQISGSTIDMALKTKTMLTWVEQEKVKKANVKRAREVRARKRKGKEEKEGVDRKEQKEGGVKR